MATALHSVPEILFPDVAARVRRYWRPRDLNPHMTVLGPTRSGKDHLARYGILPLLGPAARIVVLIVKPGGDRTWTSGPSGPWGNQIAAADLAPGFGYGPDGTARYLVYVPPGPAAVDTVKRLIEMFAMVGELVLVLGDVARITEPDHRGGMGLGGRVTRMMNESAAIGGTVIACANSAGWAETGVKDQSEVVWVGHTINAKMRTDFANIAGMPPETRAALDTLPAHSWLYVDHRSGQAIVARTSPPAAFDDSGR
jgi:hypothetical protein